MTLPPDPRPRSAVRRPGEDGAARTGRRGVLAIAVMTGSFALAGLGVAAIMLWPEGPPPEQRLGPRRLVAPLLRARVGNDDLVLMLTRRSEQDATDVPGYPAPRERIEFVALTIPELAERFATRVASVPRGGMRDAGLIAEQGATVWVWADGLGAASAVDGQLLADQEGLATLNPEVPMANLLTRQSLRMADGLIYDAATPRAQWRFDPRDFRASPAQSPPPRVLPVVNVAALAGPGGPAAFRVSEARSGDAWLGLVPATEKMVAPIAPRATTGGFLAAAQSAEGGRALWRGQVRLASAAPPNWPSNLPDRWGQAERLFDVTPIPEVVGLPFAGFLTAGTPAPIQLTDPAGLLVVHGAPNMPLGLLRIDLEGRVLWRATLPITALRTVLAGPRHLVLVDGRGQPEITDPVLVAVSLADGTVTERRLSA